MERGITAIGYFTDSEINRVAVSKVLKGEDKGEFELVFPRLTEVTVILNPIIISKPEPVPEVVIEIVS